MSSLACVALDTFASWARALQILRLTCQMHPTRLQCKCLCWLRLMEGNARQVTTAKLELPILHHATTVGGRLCSPALTLNSRISVDIKNSLKYHIALHSFSGTVRLTPMAMSQQECGACPAGMLQLHLIATTKHDEIHFQCLLQDSFATSATPRPCRVQWGSIVLQATTQWTVPSV